MTNAIFDFGDYSNGDECENGCVCACGGVMQIAGYPGQHVSCNLQAQRLSFVQRCNKQRLVVATSSRITNDPCCM